MLRAGSADTIIARRLWCIRPSTPTFSTPTRPLPRATCAGRVGARPLQADRPRHRRLPPRRRAAEDRRRRTRSRAGSSDARGRGSAGHADVEFLGRRSDDEVRDLYRRAAVVLLPGEEDFGIVPLEAQACGRPVVALARGGALETVVPGRNRPPRRRGRARRRSPTRSAARSTTRSIRPRSGGTPNGSAARASATRWTAVVRDTLAAVNTVGGDAAW